MGEERKTVLFIVEGPSDKSALEKIFKKIYKRNRNIDFKFTDGDISSDPGVTKDNVEDRIYSIVDKYLRKKTSFRWYRYLIWMEHTFRKKQSLKVNHMPLCIQQKVLRARIQKE